MNYAIQLFHGTTLFGNELHLKHRKKNNAGVGAPNIARMNPHHMQNGVHPVMQRFVPPFPLQLCRPPPFIPGLIGVPSLMLNQGISMFLPPALPHHIRFDEMGIPRSNVLPIVPDDERKYRGSSSSHQESEHSRRNSCENDKTKGSDMLEEKRSRHSNSAKHESYREDRKPYHKSEKRHSRSHREDDFRDSRRHRDRESDRQSNKDHLELDRESKRSQDYHRANLSNHEDVDRGRKSNNRGRDRKNDRRHHNTK